MSSKGVKKWVQARTKVIRTPAPSISKALQNPTFPDCLDRKPCVLAHMLLVLSPTVFLEVPPALQVYKALNTLVLLLLPLRHHLMMTMNSHALVSSMKRGNGDNSKVYAAPKSPKAAATVHCSSAGIVASSPTKPELCPHWQSVRYTRPLPSED